MRTVNVGMIGAGFMGKAHSLAYAALPIFYWPAPALPVRRTIADLDPHAANEAAARFGFERSTGDWREIIADPEVDLVDVAVPNNLHAEIAVAAAEAGKHIFCEKPLARTAAEARTMYDAVRDAHVVHMVGFNYRWTPAIALAKKYIAEGAIGQVQNIRAQYLQDWSASPDAPLSWRFDREVAGSGALGDIGSHALDLMRFLVGEITAVNAVQKTYIQQRPISTDAVDRLGAARHQANAELRPVNVDDEILAMLQFESGAIGSVEVTRNAHGRNNLLTLEVHGTAGSVAFNYERSDELEVCFADDPADRRGFRTVYTGPLHPYGEELWPVPGLGLGYGDITIIEIYHLIKAVAEDKAARPSFADGYQVALICDAIIQSSETGRWIDVPDGAAMSAAAAGRASS